MLGHITASYRLLNFKNFHRYIKIGLILDLVGSAIATFIILVVNNSMLSIGAKEAGYTLAYTSLQSNAVIIKFVLILMLVLDSVLFTVQYCQLIRFKK